MTNPRKITKSEESQIVASCKFIDEQAVSLVIINVLAFHRLSQVDMRKQTNGGVNGGFLCIDCPPYNSVLGSLAIIYLVLVNPYTRLPLFRLHKMEWNVLAYEKPLQQAEHLAEIKRGLGTAAQYGMNLFHDSYDTPFVAACLGDYLIKEFTHRLGVIIRKGKECDRTLGVDYRNKPFRPRVY